MSTHTLVRDPLLVHLDAIDRAWSQRQPIDIRQLIHQLGQTITIEHQVDLLAADLEWRWRSAGFSFRPERELSASQTAFEGTQPKLVEEYVTAFPRLRDSAAALSLLVEAEFIARSRWNNPPLIADFSRRFAPLGDLQPILLAAINEVTPLFVTLRSEGGIVARFQAGADGSLGRGVPGQRLGLAEMGGRERLVIADSSQTTVSRTQGHWTRLSLDQVRIENTSRNVVMRVAGRRLQPGEGCSDYLPLSIDIPPVRLGLELAI